MILAPSRELAIQIKAYIDKLASGTDLRSVVLVGGESIQEQFTELLKNPDVLIATPGRLLQLADEMATKTKKGAVQEQEGVHSWFKQVEWVIFDEADILLELGLAPQVYALLAKLPKERVTALFSATLPKGIIELVKVGLKEPTLIRLDIEAQLSPTLETHFLACQPAEKEAMLMSLLMAPASPICLINENNLVESSNSYKDAPYGGLIFVSTRHHVEYLHEYLNFLNIPHGSLYGTMDPIARTNALQSFRAKEFSILVVTDLAARGLDLPFLKWVLHYDFAPQEKLFIHRVINF